MARKRKFKSSEIPTSSMADIAFLLLIFFLVTTTIDTDKGLGIVLPPPGDMEIEIRKENILNCLINSQGKVLLDEEPTSVEKIHRIVGERLRSWVDLRSQEVGAIVDSLTNASSMFSRMPQELGRFLVLGRRSIIDSFTNASGVGSI